MNWVITHEKYLDDTEVKALRKTMEGAVLLAKSRAIQAPVRDNAILELALSTGLRVSEISALKLSDLSMARGSNSLIVRSGKGSKLRQVMFSNRLRKILEEYLEYRDRESEYLFISERQDHLTVYGVQKIAKKWFKTARLDPRYSIHSLRHTYATRLYKSSGYNLRLVGQCLGHANPQTTAVYAVATSSQIQRAVENLDMEEE
jgi:integrase/recombinase XerD